jgi:hypothetical protein
MDSASAKRPLPFPGAAKPQSIASDCFLASADPSITPSFAAVAKHVAAFSYSAQACLASS